MEVKKRSLLKGLSWRVVGTVDTFLISYLITGSLQKASSIGLIEVVTKFILYYAHERAWLKISWGKLDAAQRSQDSFCGEFKEREVSSSS